MSCKRFSRWISFGRVGDASLGNTGGLGGGVAGRTRSVFSVDKPLGWLGGLGGIFGPAYAIGRPLPFPEARPWRPSKRYRLLQAASQLATSISADVG
ncbi:hypothetical protein EMIHUDRAFT_232084 [Emiliania huxleyi CCMP1516]|uniref:Uncharacterized protein n=2 Tax=Emiliania huxleyi TaxID=2903 RepID=A0A0D3K6C5_EMIH1|nr:hypothetical protein EMIHUDRAFT_232084 [Emiliania huxleyi CCMP1516]EOD31310.1 hypothetical protein EMIHUDRAFT_232084 [Emiliania huxleyi CCMP1516]|eukprot:XP_005783739.1 hypothetical protein EMIHUDRAFT_232084 [Emiliania huxleyi CCMP1516]